MQRRTLFTIIFTCVLGTLWITPSLGHTELISTNPVANSTIHAPLEQISLTFSEAPLLAASQINVQQPQGTTISSITPTLQGTTLSVPWPKNIKPGTVAVMWRAVADDGHVSTSGFRFHYIQATSTSPQPTQNSKATRWREFGAIAFIVLIGVTIGAVAIANRRKSK